MTPSIWYRNGNWHKEGPYLQCDDAGFVFGAVVTDRLRTFLLEPFRLDDHIRRLRRSCELAKVPLAHSNRAIRNAVRILIEKNIRLSKGGGEIAIVMLATPGPSDVSGSPTFIMHAMPLDFAAYRHLFEQGSRLVIPPTRQMPHNSLDPAIKHRSRLHWWIATQHARQIDPLAEPLLLDSDGFIAETASANVIVVKDGKLFTPPVDSVLPGISLLTVRELCAETGLVLSETKLRPEDCYGADEVLLTCTSWCLAGVSQLNGRPIPWPGPIHRQLSKLWSERVGFDYIEQIMKSKC